jgi:hypothetical protein
MKSLHKLASLNLDVSYLRHSYSFLLLIYRYFVPTGLKFQAILCVSLFSISANLFAQQESLLEKRISLQVQNKSIEEVLNNISQQHGFNFSYSTSAFNAQRTISLKVENKSVQEVLHEMFEGAVSAKEKGNYIILTKAKQITGTSQKQEPLIINGYILDAVTSSKIAEVSVYDKTSMISAVTDRYGFFSIRIEKPFAETTFRINKSDYVDTVLNFSGSGQHFVNVLIRKNEIEITNVQVQEVELDITTQIIDSPEEIEKIDEEGSSRLRLNFRLPKFNKQQRINEANIRDTLYRNFQVSLVPFFGTNRKLSGHVVNKYSLNILGGYSMGNTALEFGGLANLNRAVVNGVQIGGLLNLNEGETNAWQLAGLVNLHGEDASGIHIAGLINLTSGAGNGFRLAGLTNFSTRSSKGVSIAGLTNIQNKDYEGTQIAGLFNFTSKEMRGAQIAPFNYAKKVRGTQVGLINIADSVTHVPVGFLTVVFKGYHKADVYTDEVITYNLALRTGVHQLHNILLAGLTPGERDKFLWTFGYGLGTSTNPKRNLRLYADLTSQQITQRDFTPAINLVNKGHVGFDIKINNVMSFIFGATYNYQITKTDFNNYPELFSYYTPTYLHQNISGSLTTRSWVGFKAGLRFF